MAKVTVITSGKGGVGKTTSAASIAAALALQGYKTVVIDFDVGLRNLDLIMGCERRVVYDLVNVVRGEATVRQALIKDKRVENLYVLPASQTRDKDALDIEGIGRTIEELKDMGFAHIICDSPAGIEKGAQAAMYFADDAIVVTNPEVSSVRDSDRIIGMLDAKTQRAVLNQDPVKCHLLITRYSPKRAAAGEMLKAGDVLELLGIDFLGVIPESQSVLTASNTGTPVVLMDDSDAANAYMDAVKRFLGEEQPHRFLETSEKRGFFSRLFGSDERVAVAG
jgi:septum site-determining protein MinD